jgi:hypothetical protein
MAKRGVSRCRVRSPGQPQHLSQNEAREIAQVIAQLFQRQRTGQILGQQPQRLHLLEVTQKLHLPLRISVGFIQFARELCTQHRPIGSLERVRRDQFIQQDRMAGQISRCPRAGCCKRSQAFERSWILEQQRQVGFASPDAFQYLGETIQGLTGMLVTSS